MTERERALDVLNRASERVRLARDMLSDPGVDLWRSLHEIARAEEDLATVRERLLRVSKEALALTLDGGAR